MIIAVWQTCTGAPTNSCQSEKFSFAQCCPASWVHLMYCRGCYTNKKICKQPLHNRSHVKVHEYIQCKNSIITGELCVLMWNCIFTREILLMAGEKNQRVGNYICFVLKSFYCSSFGLFDLIPLWLTASTPEKTDSRQEAFDTMIYLCEYTAAKFQSITIKTFIIPEIEHKWQQHGPRNPM